MTVSVDGRNGTSDRLTGGTATPAFLLTTRGVFRLVCLIVMWALTLTAAAIHMAWMSAPELVTGAMFVGLGGAAGLALPEMWTHAGVAAGVLMLAGGLLYTAGAFLPPAPARPVPGGVRLPRDLSRLRLRRRDLPVSRDHAVHRPNAA